MNKTQAQSLASEALLWLAGQPEELEHFMAATGIGPSDIRSRASDPEFLGFVLDFLLGSEDLVRGFSLGANLPPDRVLRARSVLPGGEVPDWT